MPEIAPEIAKPVDDPGKPDRRPIRQRIDDELAADVKLSKAEEKALRERAKKVGVDPTVAVQRAKDDVRRRGVRTLRAEAAVQAYTDAGEPPVVRTSRGVVRLASVTLESDGDGETYVAVHLADGDGDPQYRIFNPPYLVPDPAGDIVVDSMRGRNGKPIGQPRRLREDPLAALCEGIAGAKGGKR